MKQERDTIDTMDSELWWKYCGFESFQKWQDFMIKRIIEVSEQLSGKKKRNKYSLFSEEELGYVKFDEESWRKLLSFTYVSQI